MPFLPWILRRIISSKIDALSEPARDVVRQAPLGRQALFLWAEVRSITILFPRTFIVTFSILCVLLFLTFCVLMARSDAPPASNEPSWLVKLVVLLVLSAQYALPPAVIAGLIRVVWRLCGIWILVPVLLIPLVVTASVWLCSGWLVGEGNDVLNALSTAAEIRGFPATKQAAEGMFKGAAHGGSGEMLALIGILLLPFFLWDALPILFNGAVLRQFVQFVLAFTLAVALGLIPSGLISGVVLIVAVARRLRERYRCFQGDLGVD